MAEKTMQEALAELETEVTRNDTVDGGAVVLINALADQVEATKGDPAKATELANRMRAASDALAAAVLARTPQAPPTEPPVEPTPEPSPQG